MNQRMIFPDEYDDNVIFAINTIKAKASRCLIDISDKDIGVFDIA